MKKLLVPRYVVLTIIAITFCLPHSLYALSHHHSVCPLKNIITTYVLGITPDQMDSFDTLKAETKAAIKPLTEEIRESGTLLTQILLAEEIDQVEAKEKLDQMLSLRVLISSIAADAILEGVQILTSDQRLIILIFVDEFFELLEWIADFPGWDVIKEHFQQHLQPIIADRLLKRLGVDITDGQRVVFAQLKKESRDKIEPLVDQMKNLGLQMPGILLAEEINTDKAQDKLDQMLSLRNQISSITADAKLARVQIFTPEQRHIIKEKIDAKKNRHSWRMNHLLY